MPATTEPETSGALQTGDGPGAADQAGATLSWSARPLARPGAVRKLLLGLAIVASFTVFVTVTTDSWDWGMFCLAVLVLTSTQAFLPTRYTLSDDGIRVRHGIRNRLRPWSHFEGVSRQGEEALYLRPSAPGLRGRLSEGLTLLAEGNADEVERHLRRRIEGESP